MPDCVPTPVSVIVPAYNEETTVGPQVEMLHSVLSSQGSPYEILVVDDGSEDQTAERALEARACVLRQSENRGYGAALKKGILAAQYETIVIIDADGTYPADQIPQLLTKLETADMVVGARVGTHVHIPWLRRPAKWILGWLAARIAGRPIPDLNSGLRAFRRECVKQYFSLLSNQFSFTTTVTLSLLADEYRIVYHPIDYYRRLGKSKITSWHFMDFTILLLRIAILFRPLRVFLPLALMCGLLGILKSIYDIVTLFLRTATLDWSLFYQPVLSTSAILLLLVGLQLLLIGMVADGVLQRSTRYDRPLVPSHAIAVYTGRAEPQVEKQETVADVKQ